MKIAEVHSHHNGLEWLKSHRPRLWKEIVSVISSIDATKHRGKSSKEKSMKGKLLYAPITLNAEFKKLLSKVGWQGLQVKFATCTHEELIRHTLKAGYEQQRLAIESKHLRAIDSYNQIDFIKQDVAIEVQFGKYSFIAYDLFVKHMAFYVSGDIKVGVEILPMKSMQEQMSSGPGYYEWALYNIVRQGRGIPAVPLIVIGVTP